MQSYIRTYYRLRKRECTLISASAVPQGGGGGGGGGGGSELNILLAEMVPNCLMAFYDRRSESSGIFYYPIPAEKGFIFS